MTIIEYVLQENLATSHLIQFYISVCDILSDNCFYTTYFSHFVRSDLYSFSSTIASM